MAVQYNEFYALTVMCSSGHGPLLSLQIKTFDAEGGFEMLGLASTALSECHSWLVSYSFPLCFSLAEEA